MFGMVIHGGAGTLPRAEMSGEAERKYRAGLSEAIDAGYAVLKDGGTSLDAVTRAVVLLEDNSLFNAGRGSVFTLDGRNELDASIMDGRTLESRRGMRPHAHPQSGGARASGDGEIRTRHAGRCRGGGIRIEPGLFLRAAKLFLHRRALAAIGADSQRGNRTIRRTPFRMSAPSARWRWIPSATWRRRLPPAA